MIQHLCRCVAWGQRALCHGIAKPRHLCARTCLVQLGKQRRPHVLFEPIPCLISAHTIEKTRIPPPSRQLLHVGPGRLDPVILQGRDHHRLGKPFWVLGPFAQQAQRTRIIRAGAGGGRLEITIGFVDQDHVGHFHDPALDPLQLVAARRGEQKQKQICHLRHNRFRLPDAHRFDQHHVKACPFAQRHRLTGAPRHAAQMGLAW
mmetsp:Transcript_32492/g.62595  ORF Transcript_32492/g.62595 Transcript_32492/m.62595 type:complete len:204 (-) Transcript_32492:314-925(-)